MGEKGKVARMRHFHKLEAGGLYVSEHPVLCSQTSKLPEEGWLHSLWQTSLLLSFPVPLQGPQLCYNR